MIILLSFKKKGGEIKYDLITFFSMRTKLVTKIFKNLDFHNLDFHNMDKWKNSILATLLISFTSEILFFWIRSLWTEKSTYSEWTLHWIWELIAIIIIIIRLKKLDIEIRKLPGFFIIAILIMIFTWGLLTNSLNPIKNNYSGILYRYNFETAITGRDDHVVYNHDLECGFLYKKNDPFLSQDIEETIAQNQYSNSEHFIFWQTGIAYGFGNIGTPKFYESNNRLFFQLKLIFTVGPFVILECFIKGFFRLFFIILIINIVWILLRNEHLWWD